LTSLGPTKGRGKKSKASMRAVHGVAQKPTLFDYGPDTEEGRGAEVSRAEKKPNQPSLSQKKREKGYWGRGKE